MTLKTFGGCDQRLLDCYDADEGASAEDKVFVAELMIKRWQAYREKALEHQQKLSKGLGRGMHPLDRVSGLHARRFVVSIGSCLSNRVARQMDGANLISSVYHNRSDVLLAALKSKGDSQAYGGYLQFNGSAARRGGRIFALLGYLQPVRGGLRPSRSTRWSAAPPCAVVAKAGSDPNRHLHGSQREALPRTAWLLLLPIQRL